MEGQRHGSMLSVCQEEGTPFSTVNSNVWGGVPMATRPSYLPPPVRNPRGVQCRRIRQRASQRAAI